MSMSDRSAEALAELMIQVARQVDATANASELKPAQWSALRYLARAARSARTNRAFASYHRTTTGTVTLTLKTLVDRGLLEREGDPSDKRLVLFTVTEKGRSMLAQDPFQDLVARVTCLRPEQRAALADALTSLLIDTADAAQ